MAVELPPIAKDDIKEQVASKDIEGLSDSDTEGS